MLVKDLIQSLKAFNPDAEVYAMEAKTGEWQEVMDAEQEYSNVVTLGLQDCRSQKERDWENYIKYLRNWAVQHETCEYYNMSPVCFDEFCNNEGDEDE